MAILKVGDRVTGTFNDGRIGTVRVLSSDSASVQWDDAPWATPWYRADALMLVAPTDRQRMEEYRAEMNRLRSTLKAVAAQRDTLAAALLNVAHYAEGIDYGTAVTTILTDLVESGNVDDIHGFLS